ncbi:MAG TPA: DUF2085 domain-containing protein [Ktedonobacterales bacterium]
MTIEEAVPPPAPAALEPPRRSGPPGWLLAGLGAGWLVALVAVAFWPGASLIDRLMVLDGGVCAQNPLHSFFPGGIQLPLCSRNTGIYLGVASTTLWLAATGRLRAARLPGRAVTLVLGLAALLMAVDGFNSLFRDLGLPHPYTPQNPLRLATGLGMGVAMAAFLLPVASAILWRVDDERPAFGTPRELLPLLPILSIAWIAVASQTPPLLYPIAILSSLGLLLAVTLLNVVFTLGLTNRVGRFSAWRGLFPYLTLMAALAVIELMALFVLKEHVVQALTH